MKRLAALLLCAALLAGCTAPEAQNSASPTTVVEAFAPPQSDQAAQQVSLPLYFISRDGKRLEMETRVVNVKAGESRAVVAIKELLKGPEKKELKRVLWPGTEFIKLESARGVANVYLNNTFEQMFSSDRILAKAALMQTLHDIDGTQYVNVYSNSREPGYDGKPTGVTEYFTQELELYASQVRQSMETQQKDAITGTTYSFERLDTFRVALYFADPTGRYLLPEVREITVSDQHYCKAIIDELIKGPSPASGLRQTMNSFSLASQPSVNRTESANYVEIALSGQSAGSAMAIASIIYSISGFLPMSDYYIVSLNGTQVLELAATGRFENGRITRERFADMIGAEVPLYFPNSSGSLTRVMRTLRQGEAFSPEYRLQELLRGPLPEEQNEDLRPVLPGINPDDVPRVVISDDTAWIDCSETFAAQCGELTREQEFLLVFAMVNTVSEFPDVRRVQFLIDGKASDSFAGNIFIGTPLLKNPGLTND